MQDLFFFFQAEDGIRVAQESRGLGDVYKRQVGYFTMRDILHILKIRDRSADVHKAVLEIFVRKNKNIVRVCDLDPVYHKTIRINVGGRGRYCNAPNSFLILCHSFVFLKHLAIEFYLKSIFSLETKGYRPVLVALRLSLIHISAPTSLLSISYAVFCLKKKPPVCIYPLHTCYPT